MRQLGYVEGQNIVIDFRSADGDYERLRELADELLQLQLDVLVAAWPAPALVAKNATRTVPVVAIGVDNPVDMGLAATMARPGGNVTGISSWAGELVAKRLQVVRDLVPNARRIGILFNPEAGVTRAGLDSGIVNWERMLGAQIRAYEARAPGDFEGVFLRHWRAMGSRAWSCSLTSTPTRIGSGSTSCACSGACHPCGAAATS